MTHTHLFAVYDPVCDVHRCACGATKDHFGRIEAPAEGQGSPRRDDRDVAGPVVSPRIDPQAVISEILERRDEREIVFEGARLAEAIAAIRSFVAGAPEPVVDRIEGLLKRAVRVRLVNDRVSPVAPDGPPQPVLSAAGYSLGRAWFIDQAGADAPVRSGRELLTC